MRTRLLNSFAIVVGFWFITTTIWWGMSLPETTGKSYDAVQQHSLICSLPPQAVHSFATNTWEQLAVIKCWTAPAVGLSALAYGLGMLVVVLSTRKYIKNRQQRLAPSGQWRGISNTIGQLPQPINTAREPVELESSPLLDKLSAPEKKLLEQLLGVAMAHPHTYAGDGVAIPWLNHLEDLLSAALNQPRNPNFHALVTIAHQLGKINAYVPDPELPSAWVKHPLKTVDKEAARILGTLSAWFELPEESRLIIYYAVKYYSRPYLMPTHAGNSHIKVLATDLAYRGADAVTQPVVQQEKDRTLRNEDVHEILFSTFITNLPSIVFQSKGLPKNVHASAWKVGSRIYLLEHKIKELLEAKLPQGIAGAFKPDPKQRSRIAPVTAEFLRAMRIKGWLVTAVDSMTVPDQEALWILQAGSLQFKGIIILEVDDQHINQIPPNDTSYALNVLGPLYPRAPARPAPSTPIPSRPEATSRSPEAPRPPEAVRSDPSSIDEPPSDPDVDELQAIGLLQSKPKAPVKEQPKDPPPTPVPAPEAPAPVDSSEPASTTPLELELPPDLLVKKADSSTGSRQDVDSKNPPPRGYPKPPPFDPKQNNRARPSTPRPPANPPKFER